MTLNLSVTDDQLGQFYRKTSAIAERLNKSLPFDEVMISLQLLHDGLAQSITKFKVWKTIKLGTKGLKTADDFRKAIKSAGMSIGDWGNDILGKPAFSVASEETEVDLVNVSVGELGFKRGAERRDIIAKALSLGLELCPNEVGPQLRLQYADQPRGEWLLIGMEPITGSGGGLDVFGVGHDDDELWLSGDCGYADGIWDADDRFVFVRSRK